MHNVGGGHYGQGRNLRGQLGGILARLVQQIQSRVDGGWPGELDFTTFPTKRFVDSLASLQVG